MFVILEGERKTFSLFVSHFYALSFDLIKFVFRSKFYGEFAVRFALLLNGYLTILEQ